MTVSPIAVFSAVAYLLVCIGIGIWSARRTHSSADFFVAGRRLGVFVVVVSMNATALSGTAFVGGPGIVFASGMTSMWLLMAHLGVVASVLVVGKRLRLMAEAREVLTIPDAVAARYGGKWPRAVVAVALLCGVIAVTGTGMLALGLAMVPVFQINLLTAMLISLLVLGFYSIAGGMVAAAYTNLFQGGIILVAAVAICYYAMAAGGGLSNIATTLWEMDPEYIGPFGAMGPTAAISWYVISAVGFMGQPQIITKYLMCRDVPSLRWVAVISMVAIFPMWFIWPTIGLSMRYLVHMGLEPPLTTPDLAMPTFLLGHVPPAVVGVAFAGLVSAAMSTADSFLNIGAAAVVRDIPIAITGHSLKRELFWSRVATGGLLVVSVLFAFYMGDLTALLAAFTGGIFAAALVPSLDIGLNWKRANATACVVSVVVGLILNFGLDLLNRFEIYSLPNRMFPGAVAILVSIIIFVLVSLATGDSENASLPPDVRAAMEV